MSGAYFSAWKAYSHCTDKAQVAFQDACKVASWGPMGVMGGPRWGHGAHGGTEPMGVTEPMGGTEPMVKVV